MPSVPPPNSAIAELASTLGEDSARELAGMFLSSFAAVLHDLQGRDREERKRAAHSLKSSSRIVGATKLSGQMADLEARLTNTTGDVTPDDITATVTEFERVAAELRPYAEQAAG